MEWIELAAKTMQEAEAQASQALGVTLKDLEIVVLEEPKAGLFGRLKGEARIKARIKPRKPRQQPRQQSREKPRGVKGPKKVVRKEITRPQKRAKMIRTKKTLSEEEMNQAENICQNFANQVLDAFELKGKVEVFRGEENRIKVNVTAENLGILVGKKGVALNAFQELMRSAVRTHFAEGLVKVDLDVAGYREKRKQALSVFAEKIGREVLETGRAKALEPMIAADRKIVHDVISGIEGLMTTSQGTDPGRYIVIAPKKDRD
jgi:spoIIIJ-associated protein